MSKLVTATAKLAGIDSATTRFVGCEVIRIGCGVKAVKSINMSTSVVPEKYCAGPGATPTSSVSPDVTTRFETTNVVPAPVDDSPTNIVTPLVKILACCGLVCRCTHRAVSVM